MSEKRRRESDSTDQTTNRPKQTNNAGPSGSATPRTTNEKGKGKAVQVESRSAEKRKYDSDVSDQVAKRAKLVRFDVEPEMLPPQGNPSEVESKAIDVASVAPKESSSKNAGPPSSAQPHRRNHPQGFQRNKLVAPRPFPTVPMSENATGPRSAHSYGKNYICLTRKTKLAAYLRRCKDVIMKDGHKTLHLSAMGAAITLLAQLVVALPPILSFPPEEIHTEITTGTVTVRDEIIPDDEDEDVSYETRGKSTLMVVIKIGEGDPPDIPTISNDGKSKSQSNPGRKRRRDKGKGREVTQDTHQVIFQEPEQEDMETS